MEQTLWARQVTMSGPPDSLHDRHITIVANLFGHFSSQDGHAGGHLLVDRDAGIVSATSFWETTEALERTLGSVESAAGRMCRTIWGSAGSWKVEIFKVVGLKPATRQVGIPEL